MALDLISHQDGRIDRENAAAFVGAYQATSPLSLGELWAFAIMLRLGLLENLRRVAERVARRRKERDTAMAWGDRMIEIVEKDPRRRVHLLARFRGR